VNKPSPIYAVPFKNRELMQFGPPFSYHFQLYIYCKIFLKLCNNTCCNYEIITEKKANILVKPLPSPSRTLPTSAVNVRTNIRGCAMSGNCCKSNK
jgi:hypothetical protein